MDYEVLSGLVVEFILEFKLTLLNLISIEDDPISLFLNLLF